MDAAARDEVLNWIPNVPAAGLTPNGTTWTVANRNTAVPGASSYKWATVDFAAYKQMNDDDRIKKSRDWLTISQKTPGVAWTGRRSSTTWTTDLSRTASGARSVRRVINNRSLPPTTVIPVLVYPDVREAVAWLTDVFGFVERVRIGEDHRSQLQVGADGAVIVADTSGERQPPRPDEVTHVLKVRVADVDALFQRARSAGANVLKEPTDYQYGERECTVEDLAGHRWQFTQTLRDVAPEEWGGQGPGWVSEPSA